MTHTFGGSWTQDKLERLQKYLIAYRTIFSSNEQASYFITTYVDAFAGTGERQDSDNDELDAATIKDGSARLALELESPFDQYLFIEKNQQHAKKLSALKQDFPRHSISIVQGDANIQIQQWCRTTNWKRNRAVVFLDPYGMQVDWTTIEAIAKTQAIDLWLWFPLGQAVNRLLTKGGLPQPSHEARLTRLFGTDDWKDQFYEPKRQLSLLEAFSEDESQAKEKTANFDSINKYFVARLESIFAAVAPNPRRFYNQTNNPLYVLYFAAGNPIGAKTAVKIAQHILKK